MTLKAKRLIPEITVAKAATAQAVLEMRVGFM